MAEALGRSRDGWRPHRHALTEALGTPLAFRLSEGHAADLTQAEALRPDAPVAAVVADQGDAAAALVAALTARDAVAVMPPRRHRRRPGRNERHSDQERHLIECFFGKLNPDRRLCSRVEKTARTSMGFLHVVAALVGVREMSTEPSTDQRK